MIVVAVAVVVAVVPDTGLSPSVKPVAATVATAVLVAVEAGAEVEVADPGGLSINARPLPAVVVVAPMLAAAFEGAPKVKPVPAAVAREAGVGIGEANREGPEAGAGWVDAGGAGVDEGLIPKENPPPCPVMAAAVEAG